ncbi:serine hydrolase domain-containing protein [Thalassobacillus hwangdonensis]|uniref:Serine hydrolase domain-containing protein n=1 Tax=Thalassobacillus hwangdonensis TaxID=546108 RepID=A0ABW3L7W9_9BACI
MKRILVSTILLLALMLPSTSYAELTSDQKEMLHTYMEEAMELYQIPGATLGIVKDGEVVFQEAFGVEQEGDKVENDTLFTIGSVSKPLTSLAVMKLVEDGKVDLNATIDHYIDVDFTDVQDSEITVKDLLAHTSGITSYDGLKIADKNMRGEQAISEAVEQLQPIGTNYDTGEVHQYSAANYLLLGKVIEEVTGKTFSTYMQDEVFGELQMNRTVASYKEAQAVGYQPGFESWFGIPVKSDGWYDDSGAPYGYIASTSDDMVKLMTALLNETVLPEPLWNEYTSPVVHRKEDQYYGLGWRISTNEDDAYYYHGGETPDSRTELFVHPDNGYAFTLMTNKNNFSEVMNTIHMKEGIRSIVENQEAPPLPKTADSMRWIVLFVTIGIGAVALWDVIRGVKKGVRFFKGRIAISVLSIVLAVSLIPVLVQTFGSPWHTIQAFAPDIALLVYVTIGIFLAHGLASTAVLFKKRKSRKLLSEAS